MSLQGLLVMVAKGVASWRYNAIRHHTKLRRVADLPTKHRPQIGAELRAKKRPKPPAATRGFITEANMKTTAFARVTSLSRALDRNTVPTTTGGAK